MRESARGRLADAEVDAKTAADRSGVIPFRLRIGVTGHRQIAVELGEAISRSLDRVQQELLRERSHDQTEVRLAVVSQLAEGADRIVVRSVCEYAQQRGREARLEVVLPMEREQYIQLQQFDATSRAEFDRLLEVATFTIEPPETTLVTHEERADAYVAANDKLLTRCDVLIALWDGAPAEGKRGGTADTLVTAAARGKPCVWVSTESGGEVRDNLEPGSSRRFFDDVAAASRIAGSARPDAELPDTWSLAPLSQAFDLLDQYNREPRPTAEVVDSGALRRFSRRWLHRAFDRGSEKDFRRRLQEGIDGRLALGTPEWLAAPSARASVLAEHYQNGFKRLSTLVLLCATLAAVVLAVGVATNTESPVWAALEFVFLMLALGAFLVIRRFGFHSRWLSYRVLAERFRSAKYVAPTGLDFREQTRLQGVWVEGRSEEWLTRAFEEVWDREPHTPRNLDGELEQFKQLLARDWVGGQIAYHERAKREHDRVKRRLTVTAFAAFGLTAAFALLEAILTGLEIAEPLQRISKGLTIVLPVLGASVGVAITISQPHALAERSTRMVGDLEHVQSELEAATDTRTLLDGTIDAARIIAPEAASWFASMWFLDMEHP